MFTLLFVGAFSGVGICSLIALLIFGFTYRLVIMRCYLFWLFVAIAFVCIALICCLFNFAGFAVLVLRFVYWLDLFVSL